MTQTAAKQKKVSGRMVLFALVAFFAVIAAVNVFMATVAIRTFGGVEAENAYRAGLDFAKELAAARSQQTRNLQVEIASSRLEGGVTRFRLGLTDPARLAGPDARAVVELRHPANKRHDQTVVLGRQADGVFTGDVRIEPGQWNVWISIDRDGERLFRSVNRITIP